MQVLGLVFVGSSTGERAAMASFAREVLGLTARPAAAGPVDGDVFDLPDGATFAVVDADPDEGPYRTVGFLVADLDAALAELAAAGVETGEPGDNGLERYVHVRAPDGHLYELVQRHGG
ncbi:MAG TPA: VOC family protein [Jiangellales bacterium]|nr:VOC family protein [Jiangellales bacterium]